MPICGFDVETTGLFLRGRPLDAPEQPRLLQIGCVIADDDGTERGCFRSLIRPAEWTVPEAATDINGITTDMAARAGMPITEALAVFLRWIDSCGTLVAHNLEFDAQMISRELAHLKATSTPSWTRTRLRRVCTMKMAAPISPGGRWPKLAAIYETLFGEKLVGAHDGLTDARAAVRIYLELRRQGITGDDVYAG